MWCGLSLEAEQDAVSVPDQVDERIAQEPALAPARQALLDLCLGWAATARGLGATMAAMRWDEDAAFGVATATLVVFRVHRDRAQPIEVDLATLTERLAESLPSDQHPPHVERIDGPAGSLIRVEAVRDPSTDPDHPEPLRLLVQHWIPLPGRPYILEFEATTSNLALAADLSAEFDAIAASLGLTG